MWRIMIVDAEAPKDSSVTTEELTVLVLCDHTFKVEYVVGAFTYFCKKIWSFYIVDILRIWHFNKENQFCYFYSTRTNLV